MNKKHVLKVLKEHSETLRKKFHVKALYLFGSVARGDSHSRSDVDLMVEFNADDIGLFEFIRLKNYLEEVLGNEVDLVASEAVKEWMVASVSKERIRAA